MRAPSAAPGGAYDVLAFSPKALAAALSNPHASAEILESLNKVVYLADYLVAIGVQTIIIERNYIDGDYLDDFSNYYVKCFQTYERKCKRLHFSSQKLDAAALEQLITGPTDGVELRRFQEAYLGFVVARPLPDAIIGRTALKPYPPDGGRRNYTCTRTYKVNLFGVELTVNSLVFQEQDNVLAACATVALWCNFHKTAELFGTATPTPAQITRSANEVVNYARPIPSHGLNIQQMCNAIRTVGLDPEVVVVNRHVPIPSLAYAHLRAGLPVILVAEVEGRGSHAITLTGYSINSDVKNVCEVDPKAQCIPMVGLRINEFYGHDDQVGPFSRVVVKPSATIGTVTYPVVFESSWKDEKTGKLLALYPQLIVIPVYHKIRVTFIDVQRWLTRLHTLLSIFLKGVGKVEWDVHLTTVNDLKKEIHASAWDSAVRKELLLAEFPKYIWRASLSAEGHSLLDCLVDATDMMQSAPFEQVIWHSKELREAAGKTLSDASLKDVLNETLTPRFATLLRESTT